MDRDDVHPDKTCMAKRQAGTTVISLSPTQPDWAAARQVHVTCSRDGDLLTAVTTIGRS